MSCRHARGLLLQPAGIDAQDITAQLNAGRTLQMTVAADTVPVPLSAERWTAMAGKHVTADRLFEAIMLRELSNQYLLGYESTNRTHDGSWREIKVSVDGFSRVRARNGYRAPER